MLRLLAVILGLFILIADGATAGDRTRLGYGRLVTNDLIGDGRDRWRTGSVASSRVWGPDWTGTLPERFGQVIELRFGAEIIAPERLPAPAAGDRPYAGALSVGLHTHFAVGAAEMAVGGDLVFTGPQTGLDDFQSFLHDTVGGDDVSGVARRGQIGDDINPTAVVEMGRTLRFGSGGQLRPFVEGRAGVETMLRAGADLTWGGVGQGELLVRDPVTGHRYRTVLNDSTGFAWMLGGDVAYVSDSEFLPSNRGFTLSDTRNRLRGGVHWTSPAGHRAFYGLTWLDREFKGQRERQVVGSIRVHVDF